jgi:hypothetical protein
MGARTPWQIVRGSLCTAASAGFSGGVFFVMGVNDALDGKAIGWIALASVPVFLVCIVIAGRKALAQVR